MIFGIFFWQTLCRPACIARRRRFLCTTKPPICCRRSFSFNDQRHASVLFCIHGLKRQDSFSPLTLRTFDSKLFVFHIIEKLNNSHDFFLPPLLNVFFKSYCYITVSFFMCVLIKLLTCKVLYMSLLKLLTR